MTSRVLVLFCLLAAHQISANRILRKNDANEEVARTKRDSIRIFSACDAAKSALVLATCTKTLKAQCEFHDGTATVRRICSFDHNNGSFQFVCDNLQTEVLRCCDYYCA